MWEAIRESAEIDWLRNDAERRLCSCDALDDIDRLQTEVDSPRTGRDRPTTGSSSYAPGAARHSGRSHRNTATSWTHRPRESLSASPLYPLPDEPKRIGRAAFMTGSPGVIVAAGAVRRGRSAAFSTSASIVCRSASRWCGRRRRARRAGGAGVVRKHSDRQLSRARAGDAGRAARRSRCGIRSSKLLTALMFAGALVVLRADGAARRHGSCSVAR